MKIINNYIRSFIKLNNKYKIDLYARSISYYMVASVAGITIVAIEILNNYSNVFTSSVMIEIFKIISDTFSVLISEALNKFQLTGFSIVLLFTIVYSAARIINSFNKFAYELYNKKRHKNIIYGLVSSGLLFVVLIGTIFFELALVVFGKYILSYFFSNLVIVKIIEVCFELTIFYLSISILYIYVPPVKMNQKDVYKGTLVSTLMIYIVLEIFSILFNVLYKFNQVVGFTFVLSMFTFFTFFIYYILLYGIVINYKNKILSLEK